MRFTWLLLLFIPALGLTAFHYSTSDEAILTGTIREPNGEPLTGVTVKVIRHKDFIQGGCTDINGMYKIILPPGVYDVEFSFVGYKTKKLTSVKVPADTTTTLDIVFPTGEDENIIVCGMEDKTSTGQEFSSGEIKKLPTRNMEVAPSAKDEEVAKPTESSGTYYYLDGIRVFGTIGAEPPKTAEKARSAAKTVPKGEAEMAYEKSSDVDVLKEDVAPDNPLPKPAEAAVPDKRAGILTAGEWNDLHNWNRHWLDLQADGEIAPYQNMYGFYPVHRFTALLSTTQQFPIIDAPIRLLDESGTILWETRTDNNGKAELWAGLFQSDTLLKNAGLALQADVHGQKYDLGRPKPAREGINRFQFQVDCQAPKQVDIVWMVDATGSMGDEIEYLKTELLDVISRAKSRNTGLTFRMGAVFYRDHGDDYLTRSSELTANMNQTVGFIQNQFADGGGDTPEAVDGALEEVVFKQPWSADAVARICFVVLDASPHQSPEINASLQKSIREAARLGIRIIPITASGIQKDTEFLMKFFGLATNGTYVFLTDHSGIGEKHLEPTSDEYKVELLNELLVRIITEYTAVSTCDGRYAIRFEETQNQHPQQQTSQTFEARYYPNPVDQQFTLELPFDVASVVIYSSEGKAMRKIEKPQAGFHTVPVGDLPEGFYTIRIVKDGTIQSGKLMVVRA